MTSSLEGVFVFYLQRTASEFDSFLLRTADTRSSPYSRLHCSCKSVEEIVKLDVEAFLTLN